MKISVIDDNGADRKNACSLLREYLRERGLAAEITEFSCAEEFLAAEEHFDVALMDIFMNELSGIDAARKIRKTNADMELIFLTSSRDFALEAFAVSAANYLVKPYSRSELFAALDRVMREKPPEPFVTLRCTDGLQTFRLRDVEFFEVQDHDLYIIFSDGKSLTARMSMKQLREELARLNAQSALSGSTDYIPCGASFLVNLRYVVSLNGFALTTKTGRRIPIPRRSVSEIERSYLNYCRREVAK